jgi:acyl-ACP thioesterase
MYPLWASESLGGKFLAEHQPTEIQIEFKKETFLDEDVEVSTILTGQASLSHIRARADGRDLAKVRFNWRLNG